MKTLICLFAAFAVSALVFSSCASSGPASVAGVVPAAGPAEVSGKFTSVNDSDFQYTGKWNAATNDGTSLDKYLGDDHYTEVKGSSFSLKFTGVQVKIFGTMDKHHGSASVSIDGGPPVKVLWKDKIRKNGVKLWTSPVLPAGEHTLTVTANGDGVITADRVDYAAE